ncbi:SAVMC3_10250 family protein, partial [Streptomyces sp. NPDC041003]|uniref:SAVMC3_10250 family protein n=1 Tax=Streptomyces sp. NPDC041003 TaxID=3155730 RepID=UPI0033FDD8F3
MRQLASSVVNRTAPTGSLVSPVPRLGSVLMVAKGQFHTVEVRMREFVYLSTAKLAHFVPQLRVSLPAASVRVATPFAEVELGPSPNPADPHIKQLRRVISHIRRDAKWFGDTSILPGGWIAFEAPLNYAITNSRMVLFVDQPSRSDAYPSGGIRLLLHGSSGNLVEGLDPSTVETPDSSDGEVVERTVRVRGGQGRGLTEATAREVVVDADAPVIPVGVDG